MENLSKDVLPPKEDQKSARDWLAHYKSVPAGIFHLIKPYWLSGAMIAILGGGEDIRPTPPPQADVQIEQQGFAFTSILPILQNQFSRVEDMIFGIYSEMELL